MNQSLPHSLSQLFHSRNVVNEFAPITNGLIHHTYRIRMDHTDFLLQSINTSIFPNSQGLINNHLALYEHFQSEKNPFPHPLVKPLCFPNGEWLIKDEHQQTWRICAFIPHTCTRSSVDSPVQAEALAQYFARFTKHASTIDQTEWHIPLPEFHDLTTRFDQLEEAIRNDRAGRTSKHAQLIDELRDRKIYADLFGHIKQSPDYRLRMMHHDAKLSNVLIDERNEQWLCPIDLDTVMPGYFFSDIGDMIRSICNGSPREDSPASEVTFQPAIFEAILLGYRNGMAGTLTPAEEKELDRSGLFMTYMQTLRFFTDFLNGDLYYHTQHPEQNLNRALNQFALLRLMEHYLLDTNRSPRES